MQRKKKNLVLFMLVFVVLISTAPVLTFANPNHFDFTNHFDFANHIAPPVRSWRSSMLSWREPTRRQEGLDIRGIVPDINGFHSATLINEHIRDDVITSLIAEARRIRARAITFSYDYYPTDKIISIVIRADVATTLPHTLVRSVNFCAYTGRILTMNEATGMEIASLAERVLAEKIRANPELYYAALSALVADAFYLTDNSLVILFDGFRLSTRIGTVDTIELLLGNIRTVELHLNDYRPDGPYELKMIPLSYVVRHLGYGVRWDSWDGRIIIDRDGVDLIEMRRYDNEYIVHGTQRRSLEVAPQIIFYEDSRSYHTYVPITFFDQILPLTTYTIGWDGSITFLAYFDK
ncbi:MAG: copper amine oxidase N-terminal domain-containing protein [Defluviitaleaceae bacterium]|nr:copper amine oxidase N-terminal domain-containing protein [Defluviitaleaceae bacterium]